MQPELRFPWEFEKMNESLWRDKSPWSLIESKLFGSGKWYVRSFETNLVYNEKVKTFIENKK